MEIIFEKPVIICIGGPPGSGKFEQGKLLSDLLMTNDQNLGCYDYDNGDGLRSMARNIEFTDYMKKILDVSMHMEGKTVPGAITTKGLTEFIFKTNDGKSHFILKGVFRTSHEPDLFVKFSNDYLSGHPRYFIRLSVSNETIQERINGRTDEQGIKRADDGKKKTIQKRINAYRWHTNLIYDEIKKDSSDFIFLDIDGEKSIEEVHKEILLKMFCADM